MLHKISWLDSGYWLPVSRIGSPHQPYMFLIDSSVWGGHFAIQLTSFHPQMVFLPNLGVNRRVCLCDVASYVSAQTLDFLDLGQKSSFLDWKHY